MNEEWAWLSAATRDAITTLATGFRRHPANTALVERPPHAPDRDGAQHAALRWVYRLLLWFVLEDREILPAPGMADSARARYAEEFSARRLREHARDRRTGHGDDLWDRVQLVSTALGKEKGHPELGLPGIGSLFGAAQVADAGGSWERARLSNEDLIATVALLAIDENHRVRDFRGLDSGEFGSGYESLLAGEERKTSGSYYTPPPLVESLLDSALEPLLDEAESAAGSSAAKIAALLAVTVCDPACGSGRFLVAAAERIARRVSRIQSTMDHGAPQRAVLREVITRCIHGVDINPMATELAKIALWLESGTSPAVLNANIRVGDALLGTTSTPPGVLEPTSTADRARLIADAWCAAALPAGQESGITDDLLHSIITDPVRVDDSVLRTVRAIAREYGFFHWHLEFPHVLRRDDAAGPSGFSCVIGNPPWERVKLQEQEFFASRHPEIATAKNSAARRELIRDLATSHDPADRGLHAAFVGEIRRAEGRVRLIRDSGRYPLTARGDINTYAVFAELARSLVSPRGRIGMVLPTGIATDATTRYFFRDLVTTRTLVSLYDFENEENLFPAVHHSYRFCLWTASGVDTPQPAIKVAFRLRATREIAEHRFTLRPADLVLVNPNTGTCPVFRSRRDAAIVIGIYRRVPVLWRQGGANPWGLAFFRMLDMAADSGIFRERESLESAGWELDGNVMVRRSHPGDPVGDRMLALYEAKMVHHFDHRFGSYTGQTRSQANVGILPRPTPEEKQDPLHSVLPRYWVPEKIVADRLRNRAPYRGWLLGWRDVCRSSDVRTVVAAAIPHSAVGHKFLLAMPAEPGGALLQANLSSFVLDYCARQKIVGTSLAYSILKQLPVLPPEEYERACPWEPATTLREWVQCRVLELSYTSYDMAAFARQHGETGPPFHWDDHRRHLLRAELDSAYFHLYGVTRADVSYVLDTFTAFRNRQPTLFASTKDRIVTVYDAMTHSIRTGLPYRTIIEPTPGRGPRHTVAGG